MKGVGVANTAWGPKPGRFVPMLLALSLAACAADASDLYEDSRLIHADVPLWTHDEERIWPRYFVDAKTFGCAHNIELGDWELERKDYPGLGEWIRLGNYGVNHCFLVERRGPVRDSLARGEYSVLVDLGTTRGRGGREVNLWALQSGAVPGSDYLLLSSEAGGGGLIREFQVLRRRCPKENMRGGPSIDILLTEYCAINSQRELIDLARKMAQRPALGRLIFRGPAPEDEGEE